MITTSIVCALSIAAAMLLASDLRHPAL